jgi:protein-S-isoprenylcysteine O-methyltransferase Ste14
MNLILRSILSALILPFNVVVVVPAVLLILFNDITAVQSKTELILKLISVPFFLTGILLLTNTVYLFYKKGKGTLAPWDQTTTLVTDGPYNRVRNPMISAVFFLLIAEVLFFRSVPLIIWSALFITINMIYMPLVEEPRLENRFGEQYRDYKQRVPRWFPKLFS